MVDQNKIFQSIGCRMYTSLTIADPLSLRLVQECLSLESKLDCHGATDLVLKTDNNSQDLRGIKKLILESDWKACLSEASQHQSTYPLLPKLPLIPLGPNCLTWVWIMAHKAQLHCRLCIALSSDPVSVKSHALSATTTSLNHLILNTLSAVIHPLSVLSLLLNY